MGANQEISVAVTGANGFIGSNLVERLKTVPAVKVGKIGTSELTGDEFRALAQADFVVHLAGVNRPETKAEYRTGNVENTRKILSAISRSRELHSVTKPLTLLYSSSTQAGNNTPYGQSKVEAEEILREFCEVNNFSLLTCRLPNVFGKWSRPNYNSAVATFCYNISRDLPIEIREPKNILRLLYIDDLIDFFLSVIRGDNVAKVSQEVVSEFVNTYEIALEDLIHKIRSFHLLRKTGSIPRTGEGFDRALYATYISFLPQKSFSANITAHVDERGLFSEIIRTEDSGQFSYFTSAPGVIRGNHYHNTKIEKFLVVEGHAVFRFRHILTGDAFFKRVEASDNLIVESIPGWSHQIENVGLSNLIVFLWANEVFDQVKPDTYYWPIS